jgi:hypothetical protein
MSANHFPIDEHQIVTSFTKREGKKMVLHQHKRAIGTFPTRREAEQVLNELQDSGFPMDRVSVIAKGSDHDNEIAGADLSDRVGNKADEGAKKGAVSGGAVGGLTGLLVGLGVLAIPGVGPVMLAGAAATALATTLSGTAIGAVTGGLIGGLIGLGIPEEDARFYNDRFSRGDYLLIVEGTNEEIDRAGTILNRHGVSDWRTYDLDATQSTSGNAVDPLSPHDHQTATVVDRTTTRNVDREILNDDRTIRREERL